MSKQKPNSGKSEGTRSLTGKVVDQRDTTLFNDDEPDGAQRRMAGDNWKPLDQSGFRLNDRD